MTYPEEKFVRFIRWYIRHKRSESGIQPPKYIIAMAKRYKWTFNGYAYRGIPISNYSEKGRRLQKKKIGTNIRYNPKHLYKSWTKSKRIAMCFSIGNQSSSLRREILIQQSPWKKGIVMKGYIKFGIDFTKAMKYLDKMAEINQVIEEELDSIPMLGNEKEILGISPKIVRIVDKINC